jgi:hypothetical protein
LRQDRAAAQEEARQALRYKANRRKPLVMTVRPVKSPGLLSEITTAGPSWLHPGSTEEHAAFARYEARKQQARQAIQDLDAEQLAQALALYLLPLLRDLLADAAVFETLESAWSAALEGHGLPQKLLQAIGSRLSISDKGRKKEHVVDLTRRAAKNQAASRSRSVTRWAARYETACLPLYREPKAAWRQLVADFTAQARFRDPQDKQLALRQLRARLDEKHPALKTARSPALAP